MMKNNPIHLRIHLSIILNNFRLKTKHEHYIFLKQVLKCNYFISHQEKSFVLGDSTGVVFYLKTAFAWICGLEKTDDLDGQSIRSDTHPHDNTSNRRSIISSIRDERISPWHKQCSYAAIVLLALCAFVWAFFTDYRIRLN